MLCDVDSVALAQRPRTAAVAAHARTTPAPALAERPEGILVVAAVDVLCSRPLHGVQTQCGAWVLALGQGPPRVLPAADGTWAVVHVPRGQPHRPVRRGLSLDYALGVAEDYARRQPTAVLVESPRSVAPAAPPRSSSWRSPVGWRRMSSPR